MESLTNLPSSMPAKGLPARACLIFTWLVIKSSGPGISPGIWALKRALPLASVTTRYSSPPFFISSTDRLFIISNSPLLTDSASRVLAAIFFTWARAWSS